MPRTPRVIEGVEARFHLALSDFLLPGADFRALTERWRPCPEDYPHIFVAEVIERAEAAYGKLWEEVEVLRPESGSDRVRVNVTTTEQLVAGDPQFPGGWKSAARYLLPGLTVARWRFGKEGGFGAVYDGLMEAEGRMLWLPKVYRVLR